MLTGIHSNNAQKGLPAMRVAVYAGGCSRLRTMKQESGARTARCCTGVTSCLPLSAHLQLCGGLIWCAPNIFACFTRLLLHVEGVWPRAERIRTITSMTFTCLYGEHALRYTRGTRLLYAVYCAFHNFLRCGEAANMQKTVWLCEIAVERVNGRNAE